MIYNNSVYFFKENLILNIIEIKNWDQLIPGVLTEDSKECYNNERGK